MGLTAAPMTDGAVRELSRWRYDGEYAVYDESPYEEKRAGASPLLDPDHRGRYTCFYDGDTLMGYINLARMEGAVRQVMGSCFWQCPYQERREALPGEACWSPVSSSF